MDDYKLVGKDVMREMMGGGIRSSYLYAFSDQGRRGHLI